MVRAVLENARPGATASSDHGTIPLAQVVTLAFVELNGTDPHPHDHCEILSFCPSRRQKLETDHPFVVAASSSAAQLFFLAESHFYSPPSVKMDSTRCHKISAVDRSLALKMTSWKAGLLFI